MKVLKITSVVILTILALSFIIPLFMPEEAVVSSSINIEANPSLVFHQVNDYHNWSNWSPFDEDSTIVNTYEGAEKGVGAVRQWSGKTAGSGTLTILESEPYKYIKNKLEFEGGSGGIGEWIFVENENGVNVSWTITISGLSYPFERLLLPLIKSMTQPMLLKGLKSLKVYVEKQPQINKVKIVETPLITSLAIYDSTTVEGIGALLGKNYGKIMTYIAKKGFDISGAPIAVYHNWDPAGFIKITAAIPVNGKFKGRKEIKRFEIEPGKAAFVKHFGGYNTEETHYAIDDYIEDFNLKTKDFIWEVYVTDPATEVDSTKWQTDIFYPLK